jgi:uncharacterized membrane protein
MSRNNQPYRFAVPSPDGLVWLLKRNCSLTPRQCALAYGLVAGLSLSVAGFFWWFGAFMVLPFAALELLALGVALWWYAKHATDREQIRLEPGRVVVEWEHGGQVHRQELVREWVRVVPTSTAAGLVALSAGGQTVEVGRYLVPDLRPQLAREIRVALATG